MELVQFLAIFLGLVLKAIASIRKARQALRTMPKFNWDSI
jgi:hypothetical protein